jgi:LCP family protein required for cell wall assembly
MKQLHLLKISVFILFLLFFAFSVSFAVAIKNKSTQLHQKDLMINVLIDEIGEIKEQDEIKLNYISKLHLHSLETSKKIQEINNYVVNGLAEKDKSLKDIKNDLLSNEKQLNDILREKEEVISALLKENQAISQEYNAVIKGNNSNLHNILLLGENSGLMDTIIILSINKELKKYSLISIPRDLFYNGRKINEMYAKYGVVKFTENIKQITGLNIDKYAVWSFDSFETIIDEIGGVEIYIQKELNDNSYPDGNGGYIMVSFKKGKQELNGTLALKYARSRKSTSDFDRANRQQELIEAIIIKIKQLDLVTKMEKAITIYAKIKNNLKTNIDFFEAMSIFSKYKDFSVSNKLVLSTSNFLTSATSTSGQYILLPKDSTYNEIRKAIKTSIN